MPTLEDRIAQAISAFAMSTGDLSVFLSRPYDEIRDLVGDMLRRKVIVVIGYSKENFYAPGDQVPLFGLARSSEHHIS